MDEPARLRLAEFQSASLWPIISRWKMPIAEPAKETVIIVHGTWAAPDPPKRRWYEPADGRPGGKPFTTKLDAALQERGSPARCWAHSTKGDQIFCWSGDNTWIAGTRAASELGDYVARLLKDSWRCHIVAHSHGGNILVDALPQIISELKPNASLGKLVTLGAPFMDAMSPILKRAQRRSWVLKTIFWLALIPATFWTAVAVSHMHDFVREHGLSLFVRVYLPSLVEGSTAVLLLIFIPLLVFVLLLIGLAFQLTRRNINRGNFSPTFTENGQVRPQLLVLGSSMDEAWQILHHLRTIDNPLDIRSNVFVYLFLSVRSAALQTSMIARIHGAKSYSDLSKVAKLVAASLHLLAFLAVPYALWGAAHQTGPESEYFSRAVMYGCWKLFYCF